jgi:predicted nucleic acid-binding protein
MRRYLLDTTPLAGYLLGRQPVVALVRPWVRNREAATSILAYGEVLEYVKGRADAPSRQVQLRALLPAITPYFLTHGIMNRYADLRRQMRPPHGPGLIGDIDTLIAATCLEYGLRLITTDADFQRVSGLRYLLLDRSTFAVLAQH